MATSKLIKPTNVTVQIPAFTDQPDNRVNTNCIDKAIDGINALSDQIATKHTQLTFTTNSYYRNTMNIYKDVSGNTVTIYGVVTCDSVYSTSPGYAVLTVPKPNSELYITIPSLTAGRGNIRVHIDTNGVLYIRYGEVGQYYDILITYIAKS